MKNLRICLQQITCSGGIFEQGLTYEKPDTGSYSSIGEEDEEIEEEVQGDSGSELATFAKDMIHKRIQTRIFSRLLAFLRAIFICYKC